MIRWTLALMLALLLAPLSPAWGQTSAAGPAALSPQQAQQALSVLQDDKRRAEIIGVLEAIARAAPAPAASLPAASLPAASLPAASLPAASSPVAAAPPAAGPVVVKGTAAIPAAAGPAAVAPATTKLAIPLAPDSLGAELLVGVSSRLARLSAGVGDTVQSLTNFTLLARWARDVATDPTSQAEIQDASWKLAVVAAVALGLEYVAGRLLQGLGRALMRAAPAAVAIAPDARRRRRAAALMLLRRLPYVLARLVLDLVPVVALGAASYVLLGTKLGTPDTTRLVILALLNAYLLCRLVTLLTRAVVSPDLPGLRLLRMSDGTAAYALRWVRRLAATALFGYAATEVALLFGLYRVAHDALLKLVALVVHLMLVLIVLQKRVAVRRAIHAPERTSGLVATLRNWLAPVWHMVAIFYIGALWMVWAFDVEGGFRRLVEVFVSTAVVANLARLLAVLIVGAIEHALVLEDPAAQRFPGLDQAARRYLPALRGLIHTNIGAVAVIVLLQAWGIDSFAWFQSGTLGGRTASAVVTIAMAMFVAIAVWEASNAAVQNHLARLAREGQAARSARLRTVLPMLRTTLLVAICLFASLTVLSQIGVNTAPLLAGAGVIGLAIGFGSQKLVQDIITGLFLLLENTMQVGDVVTLGGMTGTVENLSIRTIRLRALDGAVHIVPFSAVTTVTNMTRDFAYALLDVAVGLNEEPDRIAQVVREVADTMAHEPRWDAAISDGIEIMGVERFIDTAWVLRCRIKTVPSQRWAVSRELNKRIKIQFDEQAIESPFTSYRALAAAAPPPPNAKTADEAAG